MTTQLFHFLQKYSRYFTLVPFIQTLFDNEATFTLPLDPWEVFLWVLQLLSEFFSNFSLTYIFFIATHSFFRFYSLKLQLVVSSILLWRECQASPSTQMTTDWKTVRLYPIPSVIYLIHNNVQFATLVYVDTSTYQIMGNLKIVTTGILFRYLLYWFLQGQKFLGRFHFVTASSLCIPFDFNLHCCFQLIGSALYFLRLFLKRKLSNLQWMAIVLLAVGTTTSQVISKLLRVASEFKAFFPHSRLPLVACNS